MAGITTLTGGAMARCEETGRYFPVAGGFWSAVAGCRTELMSLVPLVRWAARPWAARLFVRFERGVLTRARREKVPCTPGELAKLADRGTRRPTARPGPVPIAVTEHGTPLPRPAPVRRGPEPSPGAAY
ncbi:hypothetical protein GCM10027162_13300 [Streptomyces incanus]